MADELRAYGDAPAEYRHGQDDGFEDDDPAFAAFAQAYEDGIEDDSACPRALPDQMDVLEATLVDGGSGDSSHMDTTLQGRLSPTTPSKGRESPKKLLQTPDSWAKSSLRPDSHRAWEKNTADGLNHAKALTRHALYGAMENEKLQMGSNKKQASGSTNVEKQIKAKIDLTEELIRGLEDRIESVEDTIRETGECLFSLQRAHRSKWAPLNVCERRLELRDTRPLTELVKDHTQGALAQERQIILESRQELADQIEACKVMLMNLDAMKSDLVHDLQHKRHARRVDRHCLVSSKTDKHLQERVVLPSLNDVASYTQPPSPKGSESGSGQQHEQARQVNTRTLVHSAVQLEEDAVRLCNAADAAMLQTRRECSKSSAASQASISKRLDETEELKHKLGGQILELDEAIAVTETSLAKLKRRLDAHDKPLRTLDTQFAARNRRTSREGIRDHVHEEMEVHLDGLKDNVKVLTDKFTHTRDVLDQLKSTRQKLAEDLKAKSTALKIDDACIKVTPRKAIELDRLDPRGGRCRDVAQKKRFQMPNNLDMTLGGTGGLGVECQ